MTETIPTWSLADAGARFDDVIDRAIADGPQILDEGGCALAVVLSVEEWARLSGKQSEDASPAAAEPSAEPTE